MEKQKFRVILKLHERFGDSSPEKQPSWTGQTSGYTKKL